MASMEPISKVNFTDKEGVIIYETKASDGYISIEPNNVPAPKLQHSETIGTYEGRDIFTDLTDSIISNFTPIMIFMLIAPVVLVGLKILIEIMPEVHTKAVETDSLSNPKFEDIINYFQSDKKFYRKLKWFVFFNKKKHAKELIELFQPIKDSRFIEDPMYIYEIKQLFSEIQLNKLLEETSRVRLIKKITTLNETFWSVEF